MIKLIFAGVLLTLCFLGVSILWGYLAMHWWNLFYLSIPLAIIGVFFIYLCISTIAATLYHIAEDL